MRNPLEKKQAEETTPLGEDAVGAGGKCNPDNLPPFGGGEKVKIWGNQKKKKKKGEKTPPSFSPPLRRLLLFIPSSSSEFAWRGISRKNGETTVRKRERERER